jgi:hypothetical protein
MVLFAISKITEADMSPMVMSSRIFCCFCHIVMFIGVCPVIVMVKSNLIEVMFFPRPRMSISELVVPVDVVADDVGAVLVDDDAVVLVVVALVDEEDWVEPPAQAVNNKDNETKRQTRIVRDRVFMRKISLN